MIKAIEDQIAAAKAAGKGKSQAGGQRASTRRKATQLLPISSLMLIYQC